MSNQIARIAKRAKQIRREFPNKAWQSCIKQASAELKKGAKKKIGARRSVRKSAPKKVTRSTVKKTKRSVARKKISTGMSGLMKTFLIETSDGHYTATAVSRQAAAATARDRIKKQNEARKLDAKRLKYKPTLLKFIRAKESRQIR